jgi:hypothetical protein
MAGYIEMDVDLRRRMADGSGSKALDDDGDDDDEGAEAYLPFSDVPLCGSRAYGSLFLWASSK